MRTQWLWLPFVALAGNVALRPEKHVAPPEIEAVHTPELKPVSKAKPDEAKPSEVAKTVEVDKKHEEQAKPSVVKEPVASGTHLRPVRRDRDVAPEETPAVHRHEERNLSDDEIEAAHLKDHVPRVLLQSGSHTRHVYFHNRAKEELWGLPKVVWVILMDVLAMTVFLAMIPLVLSCAKRRQTMKKFCAE